MDTSEQYIKMCEKAEEIQELRPIEPPFDKWEAGDFYVADCPLGPCVSVHNDAGSYGLGKFTTWLPRQDQLQEMRPNKISLAFADLHFAILDGFYDGYIDKNGFGYGTPYETDEQLWLAFVMKERYNKVWNGEDWIEDNAIL